MPESQEDACPKSELSELLEAMQTSGATDSSGAFTVSSEKAREKLSQFALPNPRLYVRNLIASAVVGGATRIEFRISGAWMRLEYDGEPLAYEQLEGLWGQLLNPANARLYELAVAMNAARSLGPVELSVESWSGAAGCRLDVVGDGLRVSVLEQPGWERAVQGNMVTVREPAFKKPVRWAFGSPELNIVRGLSHFGPALVRLNDRALNREVEIGQSPTSAAWLHLAPDKACLKAQPPRAEWAPDCLVVERKLNPEPFEAVLTLGQQNEGLTFIVNGVAFSRPPIVLGSPFFFGVVVSNGLRKNLSHTDLAEDEHYTELIEQLRAEADLLTIQRMEDPRPIPAQLVPLVLEYAPQIELRLRERGWHEALKALARWVTLTRFLGDLLSDRLWRSMLAELRELGDTAPGKAQERRLVNGLKEAGIAQFKLGQTHLCVRHWERIVEIGESRKAAWLEEEGEVLLALRALCGMAVDPEKCRTPERRAALWRMMGRPGEALEACSCSQSRAEVLLALGQASEAESLLREIPEAEVGARAAETLSDLLAFATPGRRLRRQEAFAWRERALQLRARQFAAFGAFGLEDLAMLARSSMPMYRWIHYRLQASSAQLPDSMAEVFKMLEQGRVLLRKQELGALRIKTALLAAEARFTPAHPFLEVARARAAHLLRERGLWKEADDQLGRGQLIANLQAAWEEQVSDATGSGS